ISATLFANYLVRIYAWRLALGENGVINWILINLGVPRGRLDFLLFSRFAVAVALVHIMLPLVVLLLFAAFNPLEPRYLEAAQNFGAGALTRWRRVILPLMAPPAATAFLLTFVLASADYVTPTFLGGVNGQLFGIQVL